MSIKYIDEIQYCCKEMKDYYETINFRIDGDYIVHKGKKIDECPFCGTFIEIDVSVVHWGGE